MRTFLGNLEEQAILGRIFNVISAHRLKDFWEINDSNIEWLCLLCAFIL